MMTLAIEEASVRGFMNRLLREELFDPLEVRSVTLYALTRVEIAGALEKEYQSGEARQFITWGQMRPLVTALVKAHEKPRAIKIIFSGDEATNQAVHPNASALFINLAYENSGVTFTTATAQKQFALDKTLDTQWDEYVRVFFKRAGIVALPRE